MSRDPQDDFYRSGSAAQGATNDYYTAPATGHQPRPNAIEMQEASEDTTSAAWINDTSLMHDSQTGRPDIRHHRQSKSFEAGALEEMQESRHTRDDISEGASSKNMGAPLDTLQSEDRSACNQLSGRGAFRTQDPKM